MSETKDIVGRSRPRLVALIAILDIILAGFPLLVACSTVGLLAMHVRGASTPGEVSVLLVLRPCSLE